MVGFAEIVATNSTTEHLRYKRCENAVLIYENGVHKFTFKGQNYLFQIRQSLVGTGNIVFYGILSDDKTFAGNVCVEFVPKTV